MRKDPLLLVQNVLAAGLLAGVAAIFFWVPTEEFQGVAQRILYVHAPAAWVAYLAFAVVLVCSIAYLRTSDVRWDWVAHGSARTGVLFTALNLLTGMLWGRPIWGAYWAWDPRLTLTLVLFLIYVGYLAFRANASDETRGARIAAVIGIAGFLVVPLVHFSVDWWRGQHPARTAIRPEAGAAMPPEMQAVLVAMFVLFTLLYLILLALSVRLLKLESDVMDMESRSLESAVLRPRAAR
ncbi:MAG TPA: cytochrome c biogenesis protein CcsA [Actinomycetota bacterium]|nr:cytochrome c biogenesis protein CcsA [Actinomycetota bacterium]